MDNVFVINLNYRTDRLEIVEKQMNEYNIKWTRFEAIKYEPHIHGYEEIFKTFKKDSGLALQYLKGSFGCMLSHLNVIKIAKERGYNKVTILEDDFLLSPTWTDNLGNCLKELENMEWDMFYLAANNIEQPILVTNNIEKPIKCFTTGAYIIKSSLFDFVIDNVLKYGEEIDVFYADKIQSTYNVYTPKINIITQAPSYSDIQQQFACYNFKIW